MIISKMSGVALQKFSFVVECVVLDYYTRELLKDTKGCIWRWLQKEAIFQMQASVPEFEHLNECTYVGTAHSQHLCQSSFISKSSSLDFCGITYDPWK